MARGQKGWQGFINNHLRKVRPTAATTARWVSGARAVHEASMAPKECTTMATSFGEKAHAGTRLYCCRQLEE